MSNLACRTRRQFLDRLEPPEVDSIEGLSLSISIEQKTASPKFSDRPWQHGHRRFTIIFACCSPPSVCRTASTAESPSRKQTPDQISASRQKALPESERIMVSGADRSQ